MKTTLLLLSFLTAATAANPVLVRETDPLTPEQEQAALKVPDSFEIQLFASEPMINKPINLARDDRGRIWVSSTVEYPYAAKKDRWVDALGSRVRDSRDAIKILEDTDGDGRADKVTNFADGLNIPTGVLPWHKPEHKDGCIAWSIPNIWYFADTTGDGVADHREVLFGPLGWERDTHGMCSSFRLGPDGWVYATHGFNNTSKAVAKDGSTVEMHSGNVFRFRPDGSRIEIWSRGQVNPFGLAFDRRRNLYSADCHSAPVYQLLHGAIYPSFGKPHDGIGFGPAMIQHTHGSTGICGIAYVDRDVWGDEWNDRILIGNPVTSRVNHDYIEFHGSTPVAIEQPDFITSKDPWFRPVDLHLGGDGALYVADFYNRIIGHYEVPLDHPGRDRERGRIWRITKKGGAREPQSANFSPLPDHPLAELEHPSPFVQRGAAAHFQFAPAREALPLLLDLLESTPPADSHLRHVVRMAIRAHLNQPWGFEAAGAKSLPVDLVLAVPSEPAAASLLDQLQNGTDLAPQKSLPALKHAVRHGSPETLTAAIEFARAQASLPPLKQAALLAALVEGLEERGEVTPHPALLAWAQKLAPRILGENGDEAWTAVAHPDDPKSASPWVLQDRMCSDGKSAKVISSLPIGAAKTEVLTGILRSKPFPAPKDFSFWICGHRGAPDQPAHQKNFVRLVRAGSGQEIRRAFPPRSDVCQIVRWDLSELAGQSVQVEIIDGDRGGAYAWLGVTRFTPDVIKVSTFNRSDTRSAALRQLAMLLKVTAPADLRDRLRPYLPPSPAPAPIPASEKERARLDTLIRERTAAFSQSKPDLQNGKAVFQGHCAACHQIEREGALLGPQLDGIGKRGVARLCEDILDPSRNVDAHFYLTTLELNDGRTVAGFVRAESGAIILLVDAAGTEHRVQKSAIKKQTVIPLSLMPSGFEKILSESQFHDLLGWLLRK